MPTVTIHDVANAAGVSIASASRVMNGRTTVRADIRERVLKAISELGYSPDMRAQSMRSGRTHTVAFIIRDITVAPLADLVSAAQSTLHEAGYELIIACSEGDRQREIDLLRRLARRRTDGLILTTTSEDDLELAAVLVESDIPTVMFDRDAKGKCDNILIAHDEGLRQALSYLGSLGHERIALVTGNPSIWPARSRIDAYRTEMERRGIPVEENLLRTRGFDPESAYREASALLSLDNPPTAIVAGGTSVLPNILRAVRARGLRVPEDISIIGDSDSDLAMLATPSISVIRWNSSDMGRACASMMLERMDRANSSPPQQMIFSTELITRDSCAAPRKG